MVRQLVRTNEPENGLVAILDALGAANYSDEEIARLMKSRRLARVSKLLPRAAGISAVLA